ncbi:hypothetical protein GCM10020216_050400 [Nonomuraea helvata]
MPLPTEGVGLGRRAGRRASLSACAPAKYYENLTAKHGKHHSRSERPGANFVDTCLKR